MTVIVFMENEGKQFAYSNLAAFVLM